jgi:hypothetical protein
VGVFRPPKAAIVNTNPETLTRGLIYRGERKVVAGGGIGLQIPQLQGNYRPFSAEININLSSRNVPFLTRLVSVLVSAGRWLGTDPRLV